MWPEDHDEEITLPEPETPLVCSPPYGQQGRQDIDDELLPETLGRMKKQQKGKMKFHADDKFAQIVESLNLTLVLVSS